MLEYGLDPARIGESKRDPDEIAAFLELHIEQGPVLDNEKIDIGIVDSIVGLRCYDCYVHGRSDHAGNTPLHMRADTMLATAKAVIAGTEKAKSIGQNTVFTCGNIRVSPGAFNIVANETFFQLDCRSQTLANVDAVLDTVWASLQQSVRENPGLSFEMQERLHAKEVPMDAGIKALMEEKAAEAGITTRRMLSGAGHDAMIMGSITDVAMIFVPSKGG
ncbi:MAG: M20/M25/M40 family metallo-hydrolase, partial [Mogibacterium sp.]|nr:M20/M25/M40 family metallo-hydrolase [Mogibacterium sp.]